MAASIQERKGEMDRKANRKARIGVYTTGLKAYWPQFKGLKERLEGYGRFIAEKIAGFGDVEVFNFGLVDCSDRGIEAGEYFQSHNVDLVFQHIGTYVTSDAVLPVHPGSRDRERVQPRGDKVPHRLGAAGAREGARDSDCRRSHGGASGGPARMEGDRRVDARGGGEGESREGALRIPRQQLLWHARHVFRLHDGAGADGHPRGAA